MLKLITVILSLAVLIGCGPDFDGPHPSDETLIKNFQAHEADFDRLARMTQEDSNLIRIAPDFTWTDKSVAWPRPESELGFSKQRWDEYRSLFRKLDLESGILNYQPDLVLFLASTRGLVTGGSMKGYAYSVKEPPLMVELLDNYSFKAPIKHINIAYRRLKGNWYLFYKVDS